MEGRERKWRARRDRGAPSKTLACIEAQRLDAGRREVEISG
jgi:hypothetical protein